MVIMWMRWEYISELRSPTGLLFIPRWCMSMELHDGMYSTEETSLSVHQSSLAVLPTESSGSKQQERVKGMMNFALLNIFVHTCKWFLHAEKPYDLGPPSLRPIQRKACCGFLSPLNIQRLSRVWTREPWVYLQERYTTEATEWLSDFYFLVRNAGRDISRNTSSGMGKLRPAGQVRPVERLNAARGRSRKC
jgi:hypothetical protein